MGKQIFFPINQPRIKILFWSYPRHVHKKFSVEFPTSKIVAGSEYVEALCLN